MPGYQPTQNAQDIKFTFDLYGGPDSFSLTIPASELSSYDLGTEVLIGNKYIAEVTKRTKLDDYTYLIEGDGYKERLKGIVFKGKYNVYDDQQTLLPGAKEISDIGAILTDVAAYISALGVSFTGTPPYLTTGIAPYNCDITSSVADIITHVAQTAGKGWYIDQNKKIVFADIVKWKLKEDGMSMTDIDISKLQKRIEAVQSEIDNVKGDIVDIKTKEKLYLDTIKNTLEAVANHSGTLTLFGESIKKIFDLTTKLAEKCESDGARITSLEKCNEESPCQAVGEKTADSVLERTGLTYEQWKRSLDKWNNIIEVLEKPYNWEGTALLLEGRCIPVALACSFCDAFADTSAGYNSYRCKSCPLYSSKICACYKNQSCYQRFIESLNTGKADKQLAVTIRDAIAALEPKQPSDVIEMFVDGELAYSGRLPGVPKYLDGFLIGNNLKPGRVITIKRAE